MIVASSQQKLVFRRNCHKALAVLMKHPSNLIVVDSGASPSRPNITVDKVPTITRSNCTRLLVMKMMNGVAAVKPVSSLELVRLQGWTQEDASSVVRQLGDKVFKPALGNSIHCAVMSAISKAILLTH